MFACTRRDRAVAASVAVGLTVLLVTPVAAGGDDRPRYVALGDSYSAGQGLPPYIPPTEGGANRCHRSGRSYVGKFAQSGAGQGYQLLFVACSGAETRHVLRDEQYPGDHPGGQIAVLRQWADFTKVATITIGGNDARFSEVLHACATGRRSCRQTYADEERYIKDTVRPRIEETFTALRQAAPNVRIFVLNYPQIFQTARECSRDYGINADEKQWIRDRTHDLNGVILGAAAAHGLTMIDVENAFAGHEICTADPYAFGIGEGEGHFHPNDKGQQVLADKLAESARA